MVNSEITLNLNLKITQMLLKMQNDGKLSQNDIDEITKLQDELVKHTNERTFQNEKDHEYFKKHFTSLWSFNITVVFRIFTSNVLNQ